MKGSARNRRRGGGGRFGDRWVPPKAGEPLVPIALFRGKYRVEMTDVENDAPITQEMPYGIVCQHYSKPANKFLTCTAGLGLYLDNGEEIIDTGDGACVACVYADENGKDGGVSYARKLHVVNGVLLGDFHTVESEKINPKTKKPYTNTVPCKGRRCPHCRSNKPKHFGRRVYWAIGTSFVEQLADFDLVDLATQCECGGVLEPVGFTCPHCRDIYVDLESEECTDEEIQDYREKTVECGNCQEIDYASESQACSECAEPKSLSMWNVSVEVYRSGEGVNTSLQFKNPKLLSAEMKEEIKDLMDPVDLLQVYPKISHEEQAKLFNIPNPFNKRGSRREGGSSEY